MTLQHQLRMPRLGIPELHPAILTSRHNPRTIRRQSNTQHEIFMPLKSPDTLPTTRAAAVMIIELPHANRLVQTTGNKMRSAWGESDRVNAILMTLLAFCSFDHVAGADVPDANALVERSGRDEAVVRRHGDGGNAVFDREHENALALLNVPDTDCAVTGARGDVAAVGGEVEGVDVLVVAGELVADDALVDVPYLCQTSLARLSLLCAVSCEAYANDLVFSTSRQVLPVGAEAHTTNIQIAILVSVIVLEMADLRSSHDIEDLGASVAARGNRSSIVREADTAHHTLMRKIMHQLDIQTALHAWIRVEHSMPILTLTLEMWWELLWLIVAQLIANALEIGLGVLEVGCLVTCVLIRWWSRASDGGRACIWVGLSLERSGCWSADAASSVDTKIARSR
jgi:hypothetical protein